MTRRRMTLVGLAVAVGALTLASAGGGAPVGPPCPKNTVCVWKHSNFEGNRLTIEGRGVSNEISKKMNDEVSSAYDRRERVAYLYTDKSAEGDAYCLEPNVPISYVGDLFNDVASSSKLTKKDRCPL